MFEKSAVITDSLEGKAIEDGENPITIYHTLTKALANNEFVVYFQPQYHLHRESYFGLEALIRWNNGTEWIAPTVFLPLFSKVGIRQHLNKYIIKQVCEITAELSPHELGIEKVSVNFSYEDLTHPHLLNYFLKMIAYYQLPPELFMIELTESQNILNIQQLRCCIEQFKRLGISFALDDFCTGCSCLNHLRELDVDCIKIDRSFIQNIQHSSRDQIIVETLLSAASQLQVQSIVEGIENPAQVALVKAFGADMLQGFHFAKPATMENCTKLIDSQNAVRPLSEALIA